MPTRPHHVGSIINRPVVAVFYFNAYRRDVEDAVPYKK